MSLIFRRYTRTTGYAPSWFYAIAAVAFTALAIWAATSSNWLVAIIAAAMVVASIVVGVITRRLRTALAASTEELTADTLTH
jgi:hypothetical protein